MGGGVTQTHLQYIRRWCCNQQRRNHIVISVTEKLHTCKTFKIRHTTYDVRIESGHVHPSIIIKGLLNSNYHIVRYMGVEGDGDFSVMANMIENVLFYVRHLEKSECCNHVCRWSRSNLEKLFVYNPVYDGKGESTNK